MINLKLISQKTLFILWGIFATVSISPLLAVLIYLLVCDYAMMQYAMYPLLTDHDLMYMSFLRRPLVSDDSLLTSSIATCVLGLGVVFAIIKRDFFILIICCLLSAGILFGRNELAQAQVELYAGNAKIGCYVWNSKECKNMLGLPTSSKDFSMYKDEKTRTFSQEYKKEFASIADSVPSGWYDVILSVPGGAYLMSPLVLFNSEELKIKIDVQRKELANRLNNKPDK